jgi:hypothetical protein
MVRLKAYFGTARMVVSSSLDELSIHSPRPHGCFRILDWKNGTAVNVSKSSEIIVSARAFPKKQPSPRIA